MAKHKPIPVPDNMVDVRNPHKGEFLMCPKHNFVFRKDHGVCPECKLGARSIYDAWEPSQEQEDTRDEYGQSVILSMAAAAAGQKIPVEGTYKLVRCPLHQEVYIEGLYECPECKCWAS